jgi:hypothetical protein
MSCTSKGKEVDEENSLFPSYVAVPVLNEEVEKTTKLFKIEPEAISVVSS